METTKSWRRSTQHATPTENARDLTHEWSRRLEFIASYWLHVQLAVLPDITDIGTVIEQVVAAPLDLRLTDRFLYFFKDVEWAALPFTLCSPRECQLLLQLVEKGAFQRVVMPNGYRLKYHKFRYNAILDGHLRRCAIAEILCRLFITDLNGDKVIVAESVKETVSSSTFENSPRRASLTRVIENVGKLQDVIRENIYTTTY